MLKVCLIGIRIVQDPLVIRAREIGVMAVHDHHIRPNRLHVARLIRKEIEPLLMRRMVGEEKNVLRVAPHEVGTEAARINDIAIAPIGGGGEHSRMKGGNLLTLRSPAMKKDKARAILVE